VVEDEKNLKKSKKPVDKYPQLCYTKTVPKRYTPKNRRDEK